MGVLGFILIFGAVGVLCAAIFKPELLKNKQTGEIPTKSMIVFATISLLVAGLALLLIASSDKPDSGVTVGNSEPKSIGASTAVKNSDLPSLGMTPDYFRIELNKKLKNADVMGLRTIDSLEYDSDGNFKVFFDNSVAMLGSVNKDGDLGDITYLMVNSDHTEQSSLYMYTLSTITSRVLNAELSKESTVDVVVDLIKKAIEGIDDQTNTHKKIVGKIRYYTVAGRQMGLMVGFEPVTNKVLSGDVKKEYFGDAWPFKVDAGRVQCIDGMYAVFEASGQTYALNGAAKNKYAELDPIWRDNPELEGTKVNIGPMIELALSRC